MTYLTALIGTRILDGDGRRMGRVQDLVADGGVFPSVVAVEYGGGRRLPWPAVRYEDGAFWVEHIQSEAAEPVDGPTGTPDGELSLAAGMLDRQIVDARGRKVVRVNDVKLAWFGSELRVSGVDVGARSFLRRLGVEMVAVRLADMLGYAMPEVVIPWSYVASFEPGAGLRLGVERELIGRLRPVEVAEILDALDPQARSSFLDLADDEVLAHGLWEATPSVQAGALDDLGRERAATVLELMPPDEAADVLGQLDTDSAARLLSAMGTAQRDTVRRLLGYHPRSAGGLMTPEFVSVAAEDSIGACIAHLRRAAPNAESIYYVYAVDAGGALQGVVPLRELLTSDPERTVADIVRPSISARTDDDDEQVAAQMETYDLLALPVVDAGGVLVGIVTVDDVMRRLSTRAAEDIGTLTGAEESGQASELALGRIGALAAAITVGLAASLVLLRVPGPAHWLAAAMIPAVLRLGHAHGAWSVGAFVERHGRPGTGGGVEIAAGLLSTLPVLGIVGGLAAAGVVLRGAPVVPAAVGGLAVATAAAALVGAGAPRLLAARRPDRLARYARIVPLVCGVAALAGHLLVAAG